MVQTEDRRPAYFIRKHRHPDSVSLGTFCTPTSVETEAMWPWTLEIFIFTEKVCQAWSRSSQEAQICRIQLSGYCKKVLLIDVPIAKQNAFFLIIIHYCSSLTITSAFSPRREHLHVPPIHSVQCLPDQDVTFLVKAQLSLMHSQPWLPRHSGIDRAQQFSRSGLSGLLATVRGSCSLTLR